MTLVMPHCFHIVLLVPYDALQTARGKVNEMRRRATKYGSVIIKLPLPWRYVGCRSRVPFIGEVFFVGQVEARVQLCHQITKNLRAINGSEYLQI